ncbi:phosphodiester glycosidase family protein [bacterium]|nr:phosphodiester glycosidase family protein [bacterium]
MHQNNRTGFYLLKNIFKKKNIDEIFDYLIGLPIKNEDDLCVFLYQIRASRPIHFFDIDMIAKLSRLVILIESNFDADLSQVKEEGFWNEICLSIKRMHWLCKGSKTIKCHNVGDLIAAVLMSDIFGYPVICFWPTKIMTDKWIISPTNIQRFFPWESQLIINVAQNKSDLDIFANKGLNPALIVDGAMENVEINSLLNRLCSRDSFIAAKKNLIINKKGESILINKLILRQPYHVGLNKLAYFSSAVSLSSGSGFYQEEQLLRRIFFSQAVKYILDKEENFDVARKNIFFNAIGCCWLFKASRRLRLVSDCSLAFRNRVRYDFLFYHLTAVELSAVIIQLGDQIYRPNSSNHLIADYKENCFLLDGAYDLLIAKIAGQKITHINDSKLIIKQIRDINISLFCFLDGSPLEALILTVLKPLRRRLLNKSISAPIYIIVSSLYQSKLFIDYRFIDYVIENNLVLKNGIKCGLLRVVKIDQGSNGINLFDLDAVILKQLIKNKINSLICSFNESGLTTSYNLAVPWMNIGQVTSNEITQITGLGTGSGYALIKTNKSPLFIGYPIINKSILDLRRNPVGHNIKNKDYDIETFEQKNVDGAPVSGVVAVTSGIVKKFDVGYHSNGDNLPGIINKYNIKNDISVIFGCNGGYFFDKRIVDSKHLPGDLLNSPCGLFMINGELMSLPLFNHRPALVVDKHGKLNIIRLNYNDIEINIKLGADNISLNKQQINPNKFKKIQFYLCTLQKPVLIPPKGFVAIRFLFNKIIGIQTISTNIVWQTPCFTLLIPDKDFSSGINKETRLSFFIKDFGNYESMIEAGPLLMCDGEIAINLKKEKWHNDQSKEYQFSEIGSNQLRSARTAVCVLKNNRVAVIVVNSRTLESVGMTHHELIEFMNLKFKSQIVSAMEFDSGGSSTFWAEGSLLNINSNLGIQKHSSRSECLSRIISNAILLVE